MAIQLSGSLAITGSLTATSQIVAQTLNVQQVTSSIVYSSGSNIFGNSVSNTQQFTGSLQVSGSNHYFLGKVGIGTTSPDNTYQGLTIQGSDPSLRLKTTGASGWTWIECVNSSGVNNVSFGVNQTSGYFGVNMGAGMDNPEFAVASSGNVGIGTTSPVTNLHIVSNTNTGIRINATAANGSAELDMLSNGTQHAYLDYGPNQLRFRSTNSDMSAIISGSVLVLQNDGNVGIGTTSPSTRLEVRSNSAGVAAARFSDSNYADLVIGFPTAGVASIDFEYGAAGDLAFRSGTGKNERVRITSGGNVGINTTSPGAKLDVSYAANNYVRLVGGGGTTAGNMFLSKINNYSDNDPINLFWADHGSPARTNTLVRIHSNETSAGGYPFRVTAQGTLASPTYEAIAVNYLGNVGIGTSSPSVKLHVLNSAVSPAGGYSVSDLVIEDNAEAALGIVGATYSSIYFGDAGTALAGAIVYNHSDDNLGFRTNGNSEKMRITSGGSVGIGTTSPGSYILALDYNATGAAVMSIKNSSSTGYSGAHMFNNSGTLMGHFGYGNSGILGGLSDLVYFGSIASKAVVFTTADTERMRITSGGNVGIGTTSPSLHSSTTGLVVRGSARGIIELWDATSGKSVFQNVSGDTYIGQLDKGTGSGRTYILVNGNGSSADIAMTLLANSNVGIGTSSPADLLHLAKSTEPVLNIQATASGKTYKIGFDSGAAFFIKTADTGSPFYIQTGGSTRLHITDGGNVGIGTTSPSYKFVVAGSSHTLSISPHASGIDLHSTANIAPHYQTNFTWYTGAIGAGTQRAALDSSGNLTIAGTLTENSSLRYKENIENIKYGLDKIVQLRGVTYTKKENGIKELGLIAEEVNEVLPDIVLKNEEGEPDSISYGRITAVLIEAIKELKQEIEELKANK